ncbi:MAG TPA: polysaccharide biosynthesis protein [Candidatus Limnocylindrales bacterium]|nr:polysaccharide biosynthesis protein [Candidatus Limnocylindrales bacterium]
MFSSHSTFVKGAAILAAAGIASRIVGAFFRIVLAALLGDEGIGLFQYAYPIYTTLLVISTAGIPVALSKIMAEKIALNDYREAIRVFKIVFSILTLTGFSITLVMLLSVEYIATVMIKDVKAVYPLMVMAPAIFFVTIMAAVRGFFQGQQNMMPTAASQILEQLVRVGFSIALVIILLPRGVELAVAGATSGTVIGAVAGLLLLAAFYRTKQHQLRTLASEQHYHHPEPFSRIAGRIALLAVPITIGSLAMPLLTVTDLAVVPRQLQAAGFDIERARALYGQLTGMAGSVVNFPNVIAIALSMSLVPTISEAYTLRDKALINSRVAVAVKLTVLFSLPSAIGLFLLAEPITVLLFNNAEAGYSLAFLSWSVVPLCLYVTTTGIIQGLGRPITPAVNMFYGGLVKLVLTWFLTAIPALNVGGAALATVIGIGVAASLNLYHVTIFTEWRCRLRELVLLPGIAVAVMAIVVYIVYYVLLWAAAPLMPFSRLNALATLMAIISGIFFYGAALLVSGGLGRDELTAVPIIGKHLLSLAMRFKLLCS